MDEGTEIEENKPKNRGRKPLIELNIQLKHYKKYKSELLTVDKEIKPFTDQIFDKIRDELDNKMTTKAIHWAVQRHAADIFGENNYIDHMTKKTDSIKSTDEDIDYLMDDGESLCLILHVRDPEEQYWFDLIENVGPTRSYTALRPGWSDMLFKVLAREASLKCVLNFKRANIIGNEFKAIGACNECKGTVKVTSSNNRQTLCLEMTKGTEPHTHTKLRRMTTAKSNLIANELMTKTTNEVYLEQASNIRFDTENLPRSFVNRKSIENVKGRINRDHESAINRLRMLKYSPEHGDSIKEISTDPFCVLFWTKIQQYVYIQIKQKHGAYCSLDATGGLIRTDSLTSEIAEKLGRRINQPHVFLYLISVKQPDGKSTPVGQMLSAQQDSIKISYFLDRWLQDFPIPNEITVDDSAALQKSCAKSFAQCKNTSEYVMKCFDFLSSKSTSLPLCFMRLDISHLVKNWHRNKDLKKMDPRARQLYLAIFGFLMQCEDFGSIERIVEHMLTIANIPWSNEQNEDQISTTSLSKLLKLVQSHEVRVIENDDENIDEEEQNDEKTEFQESFVEVTWFDQILNRVEEKEGNCKSKNNLKNSIYFNPKLNDFFRKELNRIPLWSAVMKPHFRSKNTFGISNDTEARFNVIKNVVFKNTNLPARPDVFIEKMIDMLNKVATLNRLEVKHKQNLMQAAICDENKLKDEMMDLSLKDMTKDDHQLNQEIMELSLEEKEPYENWKGKGEFHVAIEHKKHRSATSILNKQVAEKLELTKLVFLNDGYLCRTRNSKFPLVEKTTAFDIASYLLCCRIADELKFKTEVFKQVDEHFRNFLTTYLKKGSHQSTYLARNKVLMAHFEQEDVEGMKVLNCQATVVEICRKIFTDIFPVEIETSCQCKQNRRLQQKKSLLTLSVDLTDGFNLNELEPKVCKKCDCLQTMIINLNALVFMDVTDQEMLFSQIPQTVLIEGKICILFTIVQNASKNGEPNYILHIRRSNQEWYTYDYKFKKTSTTKFVKEKIKVHLLCYTCPLEDTSSTKKANKKKSSAFHIIENFHTHNLNGIKVNVKNVCAPDAILHILCNIYSEGNMKKKMEENPLTSLIRAFNAGNENEVYHHRAISMLQLKYPVSVVNFSEVTIDCNTNIYTALESLCSDIFPSAKIIKKCDCGLKKRNLAAFEVNFKELVNQGIESLSNCILLPKKKNDSKCLGCNTDIQFETEISDIIFIDVEPLKSNEETIAIPKTSLIMIPQNIEFEGKFFRLKAVVEYQPNENGLSHYVSHFWKNNMWRTYNDLFKKTDESKIDQLLTIHMLVYVNVHNN